VRDWNGNAVEASFFFLVPSSRILPSPETATLPSYDIVLAMFRVARDEQTDTKTHEYAEVRASLEIYSVDALWDRDGSGTLQILA